MSNLKSMKKRDIVTELQKVCDLTRPTLLKLTKRDLIKMYDKFASSSGSVVEQKEQPKEQVKKPREKKQRPLLDFSSDEEEEEKAEEEKKPIVKPVVKSVTKKVKKVKKEEEPVEEPEHVEEPDIPELKLDEPVVEEKVKPVKAKKVNEIKSAIKELLKSFKEEVSKAILQYKKDDDSNNLIDEYNQLRVDYEQEVSEILDDNKSKVSEALLDYVDGLIDVQKRRVERFLDD